MANRVKSSRDVDRKRHYEIISDVTQERREQKRSEGEEGFGGNARSIDRRAFLSNRVIIPWPTRTYPSEHAHTTPMFISSRTSRRVVASARGLQKSPAHANPESRRRSRQGEGQWRGGGGGRGGRWSTARNSVERKNLSEKHWSRLRVKIARPGRVLSAKRFVIKFSPTKFTRAISTVVSVTSDGSLRVISAGKVYY